MIDTVCTRVHTRAATLTPTSTCNTATRLVRVPCERAPNAFSLSRSPLLLSPSLCVLVCAAPRRSRSAAKAAAARARSASRAIGLVWSAPGSASPGVALVPRCRRRHRRYRRLLPPRIRSIAFSRSASRPRVARGRLHPCASRPRVRMQAPEINILQYYHAHELRLTPSACASRSLFLAHVRLVPRQLVCRRLRLVDSAQPSVCRSALAVGRGANGAQHV